MELKVLYIIPTLGRESIARSIMSILDRDVNASIMVAAGGTAGQNRNKGLRVSDEFDWIVFLDDDDVLTGDYLKELDNSYDIVILRMLQYGNEIPNRTNEIRWQNVGINFAIRGEFFRAHKQFFGDEGDYSEDWRYFEKLLTHQPKIKITDGIYYIAETQGGLKK